MARYTLPDGTKAPGWLKAPNGKPTKLTERQWVQVRTEAFKQWFGDWEVAAPEFIYQASKPVVVDNAYSGSFREIRDAALSAYHLLRHSNPSGLRTPSLDNRTRHGAKALVRLESNEKFASKTGDTRKFQIVSKMPELLENATWYGFEPTRKESQTHNVSGFHYLLSKTTIDGHEFDVAFAVREDNNGNFFHNHTLYKESGVQASWAVVEGDASQGSVPAAIPPDDLSLYRPRRKINIDGVSKVIDANGEPLVVYHGTNKRFTRFKTKEANGSWFSSNYGIAANYGRNVHEVYLKILNPKQVSPLSGFQLGAENDGFIYLLGRSPNYAVIDPTQIKFALGNTGAFSSENPDIRYARAESAAPEATADELLARVQAGEVSELTPDEWARIQQAFLGQAAQAVPATGVDAPTFKTWFGNSRIRTKAGQPVTMYHATNAEFMVFDAAKTGRNTPHPTAALGFFFTNDQGHAAQYGNNILSVYLAIERPYVMTDADLRAIESTDDAKAFRKKLEARGYDGIVLPAETRTRYVAAFRPDQIKRIDNSTYTRGEPDMRFALARPAPGTPPQLKLPAMTSVETMQRAIQDRFLRFKTLQNWLKQKGIDLTPDADVYGAEERSVKRFAAKAEDFRAKTLRPLVQEAAKARILKLCLLSLPPRRDAALTSSTKTLINAMPINIAPWAGSFT